MTLLSRRLIIKQLMLAAGSAALLPSCVFDKKETASATSLFTEDLTKLLVEIAETIIPVSGTPEIPGAKSLHVEEFIIVMVEDCFDQENQAQFIKGLSSVNDAAQKRFNDSFTVITPAQRNELFKDENLPAEVRDFFSVVKQLTIRGYMTSQYILTEVNPYLLVPGPSKGCVAV